IPLVLLAATGKKPLDASALAAGAVDVMEHSTDAALMAARLDTHIALHQSRNALEAQNALLESLVMARTAELEANREELRQAMHNLRTTRVTNGVFWVQVPEAGLYILCGSPADVVKHL